MNFESINDIIITFISIGTPVILMNASFFKFIMVGNMNLWKYKRIANIQYIYIYNILTNISIY